MAQIEIPQLPAEKIAEIHERHARGESVKAISDKTGIGYSVVWFYAINKGQVIPAEQPHGNGPCWCGGQHYAKNLCRRHYQMMQRALGKAA